jgi:hypothetical protein
MFGDRMVMHDSGVGVKLHCGHNHPQQNSEKYCKLCGVELKTILGVCDVSDEQEQDE